MTSSQNTQHAYDKGLKNKKGENNGQNILKNEDVLEIRAYYKSNPTDKLNVMASKFNVTVQLIWQIRNNKCWTHI